MSANKAYCQRTIALLLIVFGLLSVNRSSLLANNSLLLTVFGLLLTNISSLLTVFGLLLTNISSLLTVFGLLLTNISSLLTVFGLLLTNNSSLLTDNHAGFSAPRLVSRVFYIARSSDSAVGAVQWGFTTDQPIGAYDVH